MIADQLLFKIDLQLVVNPSALMQLIFMIRGYF